MNRRDEKHYRRTPAVAYRLSDGKRFEAESLTQLCSKMGIPSYGGVSQAARTNHVLSHEWFVCHLEDEQMLKPELEHWMRWYDGQRGKCRAKAQGDTPKPEKVPFTSTAAPSST